MPGLALLLAPMTAAAQTAPAAPPAPAPRAAPPAQSAGGGEDEEEIVVTGQKPRGSVVGDIPPEVTLNAADVRAYGVNNISDLLDQLSPQTTSGRGSGRPVVLLNGRRISGFGEIRDLPTEAITRVEILPEEVALKYGYSADQRVVNIVLRERFLALVGEGRANTSTEGGGTGGNAEGNYVRIRGDSRTTINLRAQGSARLKESQRDIVDRVLIGNGTVPFDVTPYRTLRGASQQYSGNAVYATPAFGRASASFNGSLSYTTGASLRGLPGGVSALPASDPYFLSIDPLHQRTSNIAGHFGAGLNGDDGKWRWSLTGNYDHADSRTRTETGPVGGVATNRARSLSDTGNVQAVAGGPMFALPAGDVTTNVKIGAEYIGFSASSLRGGVRQANDLNRRNVNEQVNIDLPIASRRNGTLAWLGNFSLNGNAAVTHLSDFGTLKTVGYGFNWSPAPKLNLIGSFTDEEGAPSVNQLGDPIVVTPQVRVFDYSAGQTVDVTQISGGNPGLRGEDRHTWKLGATLKPFEKNDFTFTANYVRTRTSDAIALLPEPTADLENAFPERFLRNAGGQLFQVDTRSVNFERERKDELRFGFNVSINLKSIIQKQFETWIAARRAGKDVPPPIRPGTFQPVLAGNKADLAAREKERQERQQQRRGGNGQQPAAGQPTQGQEAAAAQSGAGNPPTPPAREGGPPPGGGFGGPGGGFGGPGGGGFGGGFGGGGGFGRGGPGRGQVGGRLQIALYDTWTLRDDILIRRGVPVLDLLDGDSVGSGGGQPKHQVQLQLGYSNNGLGARFEGNWRSATSVRGDPNGTIGDLRFAPLTTTNLRLFADIGAMPRFIGKPWARGLRVSFGINNIFNDRQRVRDVNGDTPLRYQPAYLDPIGRTVSISVRKLIF